MPLLKKGDIVVYKNGPYKEGNIILFKYDELVLTHRLIKAGDKLVTKGDNTPFWDRIVDHSDVIGVAEYVIRDNKIVYLNKSAANRRFVKYSLLEMYIITNIKKAFRLETFAVNAIIKKIFLPLYLFNYLLLLKYAKKIR